MRDRKSAEDLFSVPKQLPSVPFQMIPVVSPSSWLECESAANNAKCLINLDCVAAITEREGLSNIIFKDSSEKLFTKPSYEELKLLLCGHPTFYSRKEIEDGNH